MGAAISIGRHLRNWNYLIIISKSINVRHTSLRHLAENLHQGEGANKSRTTTPMRQGDRLEHQEEACNSVGRLTQLQKGMRGQRTALEGRRTTNIMTATRTRVQHL